MKKRCYNCGCELSKKTKTKEHIPMKGLYDSYLNGGLTSDLLTVPACELCNNQYSKIENNFRDIIVLWGTNEDVNLHNNLIKNTVRSRNILSKINYNNETITYLFNSKDYDNVHIKNFKGLYYNQYGTPLPKSYKIIVWADLSDKIYYPNMPIAFKELIRDRFEHEDMHYIGHQDIFQFEISDMGFAVQCKLLYFNKLLAWVFALKC